MMEYVGGVLVATVTRQGLDAEGQVEIAIQGLSSYASSRPARLASFMAGNGTGALFVPEKGDQVLVAFINGSPNEPVVIGCLWSSVDKAPAANTLLTPTAEGDNYVKMIRTPSGHEIRLTDEPGKGKIEIIDSTTSNRIVIDAKDNKISVEATEGEIVLSADKITIASIGDITMKGRNIHLNPPQQGASG